MDYDGFQKITEYIMIETVEEEIIEIEQKVTYIETDGTEREYFAKGDGESIEIIMPDTQEIDVNYAKDSISDLDYKEVIVGVYSEDGILIIPEETVPLIVEYGYFVSLVNEDMHVILDNDVVKNLEMLSGEVILKIDRADDGDMTEKQQLVVGDNYAIVVLLTVDGEVVHELGGIADITVEPGFDAAYVYYVDEEGNRELIPSTYDPETGNIEFEVNHFSIYMITMEEHHDDTEKIWWLPWFILIITLILMYAPLVILRWYERD